MNKIYYEILPHIYWMYKNEPPYVIRFILNSSVYLTGFNPITREFLNSEGVKKERENRRYIEPPKTELDQLRCALNEYQLNKKEY